MSAKARYAVWLNGVLPGLVPWTSIFHARGGGAAKQRARAASTSSSGQGVIEVTGGGRAGWEGDGGDEEGAEEGGVLRYAVRLKGLRHPLLLGDYLKVRASCAELMFLARQNAAVTSFQAALS